MRHPFPVSRRKNAARAAVAALMAGLIGCQWLANLHEPDQTQPSAVADDADADASADTGVDANAEASCGRGPPPPPDAVDTSSDASNTYFFVLRDEPVLAEPGLAYDLDCKDTRSDDGGDLGCRSRGGSHFADEPNGGDNQGRRALSFNGLSIRGTEYRDDVGRGREGIVIALSGYSGEDTDPEVAVGFILTSGINGQNKCADAGPPDMYGAYTPLFNGCDNYFGDPRYSIGGAAAARVGGYVTKGTLVVREPMRMWFPIHDRFVEAQSLVFTAQVRRTDAGLALENGTIGGRIFPEQILPVLGEQPSDDADRKTFCRALTWETVRQQFCQELDLPAPDAGSPKQSCGALSFAFTFGAFPAQFTQGKNAAFVRDPTCGDAGVSFTCDP